MGALLDILRGKLTDATVTTGPSFASSGRSIVSYSGGASVGGFSLSDLSNKRSGWDYNVAAYRCAATTAANLASVDLAVMVGDEATENHPMARLWNTTGAGRDRASARVVREVMMMRAELQGEALAYLAGRELDPLADPTAIHPIYEQVTVLVDGNREAPEDAKLLGFQLKRAGRTIGLLPDQVLWLRYPHPDQAWKALAPWKAAMAAAELDAHARTWQESEFVNGAQPSNVVYLGDLDEPTYLKAKAEFVTQVQGPGNAGRSMLTAGPIPAKVQRLSMTPAEMAYLESRKANAEDVMQAFGYPPDYFQGQATYENRRASKVQVWSDLYLPKLDVLASEFDRQLLPADNETAGFDVSEVDALQENQDAIYNRIRGIVYTDALTMDEARAQLGQGPLDGGAGEVTLTEYRARITQAYADPATAPNARSVAVGALLPIPRRAIAVRGVVRVLRPRISNSEIRNPVTRRTPRTLSRPRVLAFYDAHERIGQRAIHAYSERQRRIVLRNLDKLRTSQLATIQTYAGVAPAERALLDTRAAADEVFDAAYWQAQLAEATEPWMRGVWEGGSVQIADALSIDFDRFDAQVLDAMNARRNVLAHQVTGTTRAAIDSAILTTGAESGWDIPTMADALRAVFDDLDANRATTIARTETVGGYNGASNMTAVASGVVAGRRWLATKDSRTRESHADMDGETVEDTTSAYSNGLLFPGDPSGPPAETVNCRCVETYDVSD